MLKLLCTVVLILLSETATGNIPEDDFRIINRQDLLATNSDWFEDNTTRSFSQLLFDVARDQLVVGARDALYRLSLRGLQTLEKADWPAPPEKAKLCQDKGQTEEDCHNYVMILLSYGHKLFACGTQAFSPQCSWREIEQVGKVLEWVLGVAKCPHNPHSNVTAILTTSGEYYVGTPTDFASSDTAIYRSRGASPYASPTLRSPQYDLSWVNEPQFVGSFEDDQFVYFVYREVAVEFMNCGKIIYSRISRVCKNDAGGMVSKDKWSTFLKARLNCSTPGDYPFYYDQVQGISYLADEKIIIATFTTPSNSIAGSAVCAYNMTAIRDAFDGPFRVQDNPTSSWEPKTPSPQAREHFQCARNIRSRQYIEYNRFQLMHDAIQPISGRPIYEAQLKIFTHITADITATKNTKKQFVLFVATEDNNILKLAALPNFSGACLIELWKLNDDKNRFQVNTLQFVKETMSVYIGGETGILRLGAHRCSRYSSRVACVGAGDPYCGWEEGRDICVDTTHLFEPHFHQSSDYCPVLDMPVDGGWSTWSDWDPCIQDNESTSLYSQEKPDMCMCRTRKCDNPSPANGGQDCKGATVAVSRCTVHGGWTQWSPWSECSSSCGIAVKTRRRSCAAPAPKYGGRVCVGADQQELYCSDLPPCPNPGLAPIDGGWSPWSGWSTCAAEGGPGCGPGAGWRDRHRTCNAPAPKHGGLDCEGSKVEKQACDLKSCEMRRATAWTPWLQVPGNATDGSYAEKRFKFLCKAATPEQIKLTISKEEDRYCTAAGSCSSTPQESDSSWSSWGPWAACSASCGGGQQLRTRACLKPPCTGAADMLRPCNMHACYGEWSCWSEWSECTGVCDVGGAQPGRRMRTRTCLSPEGCADAGAAHEQRVCLPICADEEKGWGAWSDWSECSTSSERVRRRTCEQGACTGPVMQVALCSPTGDDVDNELNALPYSENVEMASFVTMNDTGPLGVGGVVGCIITAFIIGCLLTLGITIFLSRRRGSNQMFWSRRNKVPSSPHYITAKQNSYVTVPLKDVPRKAKRQPSFTGISSSSNGIVLSKSNNISNANNHSSTLTTPKLYPKAIANEYDSMGTLKRNSQQNNKNHFDFEEEKFY